MANLLAGMTDAELAALFEARAITMRAEWHDVFEVTDALLAPESIRIALAHAPRQLASALRAAALGDETLTGEALTLARSLALVNAEGRAFGAVRELLAADEFVLPPHAQRTDHAGDDAESDASAAAHAAELAFLTIARVADVLLAARTRPLGVLQTGGLRQAERKRLIEAGLDLDQSVLDTLVELARNGGLLTATRAGATLGAFGDSWLEEPFTERWAQLARRQLDRLPEQLAKMPVVDWAAEYPWDPRWAARAQALRTELTALGVLNADSTWTHWGKLLRDGETAGAVEALAAFVPHEVDRIFVQHDYTIIAPGPLQPRIDLTLRRFADANAGGHASGYRLNADSITRALTSGMSVDDMLGLLTEISLSGTPQPVEYLIRSTGERHGAVQVSADHASGATLVASEDAALLERLAADRALRMLNFTESPSGLTTVVSPHNTHWALLDAGYPSVLSPELATTTPAPERDEVPAATDYGPLVALIRSTTSDDTAEAWLNRELELAARERGTIAIEVAMPDGSTRELILQISAFSGGRLRGLDRGAEVERTLPVSSIRSARPAQP